MLSVALVFIFFAVVSFLGFIINALFYKTKISNMLPLMLIGVLVGPVLKLIGTGPTSLAALLTPYISAVAISFILFDIGLNMKVSKLKKVITRATSFTFVTAVITGILVAIAAHAAFGWTLIESFIFGFAVCGPSSLIVPTLMKLVNAKLELKTTLLYESVTTDILQLIIPLTLLGFILSPITSAYQVASFTFTYILGSVVLAVISALFWLYISNRYIEQNKSYSWMLTITMIIASYGIATWLGLSGAITTFVFGLAFANLGGMEPKTKHGIWEKFELKKEIKHIQDYHREIVFFTSTFFFVYIGILLNLDALDLFLIVVAALMVALIILVRFITSQMLKPYFSKEPKLHQADKRMVYFDISRGLSPAIIATIPLTMGITIPFFLDAIFLIILFTNIGSTIGILLTYRKIKSMPQVAAQQKATKPVVAGA